MMLGIEHAEKKYDCSSLRLCSSGGETLLASTYLDFKKRFCVEIINGLGCGELHCWLSTPPGRLPAVRSDPQGLMFLAIRAVIVDEDLKEVAREPWVRCLFWGPPVNNIGEGRTYRRRAWSGKNANLKAGTGQGYWPQEMKTVISGSGVVRTTTTCS